LGGDVAEEGFPGGVLHVRLPWAVAPRHVVGPGRATFILAHDFAGEGRCCGSRRRKQRRESEEVGGGGKGGGGGPGGPPPGGAGGRRRGRGGAGGGSDRPGGGLGRLVHDHRGGGRRRGGGGGGVAAVDGLVDLLAVDRDLFGGDDAQPDLVAADLHHGDRDVV